MHIHVFLCNDFINRNYCVQAEVLCQHRSTAKQKPSASCNSCPGWVSILVWLWVKQGKSKGEKSRCRKLFQIQDPKLTFGSFQGLRKNRKSCSATFVLALASSLCWALLSSHFTWWWCCERQRKQGNWQVKYFASFSERKHVQLRGADSTFLTKHMLLPPTISGMTRHLTLL